MHSWLVLICLGVGNWPKMTHINHRSQNSELSQKVLGSAGVRSHWIRARISAWPPKVVCKLWRYNLCLCVGVGDERQLGRKTFAKLDDLAHALCRLNISWTLLLQPDWNAQNYGNVQHSPLPPLFHMPSAWNSHSLPHTSTWLSPALNCHLGLSLRGHLFYRR